MTEFWLRARRVGRVLFSRRTRRAVGRVLYWLGSACCRAANEIEPAAPTTRAEARRAVGRVLYWLGSACCRAANEIEPAAPTARAEALRQEVRYWRSVFHRTNEDQERPKRFHKRLAEERRFQPYLERLVSHLPDGSVVRVLDVGSGPLSQVGTVSNRWRIKVTAVDPLADAYREEFGIVRRGVVPKRGEAETLLHDFPGGAVFDLVYCRNALDHTRDPLLGIQHMVRVCKADGVLFLNHTTDEGKKQRYSHLHQWDFSPRADGDLIIAGPGPGRPSVSLRERLRGIATVQAQMTGVSITGLEPNTPRGWHTVVIRPLTSVR